jgi:hypothetical protein
LAAQGFYFDIGLGAGKGKTEINGTNVSDVLDDAGKDVSEIAVDIGFKAGYGPVGGLPLYFVAELAGIGHRFQDSSNYVQFNSYSVGPGVIFYPIPLIQLGLSVGYSFVSNDTDFSFVEYMYDSKDGFAWNVSAAFDLRRKNHGCLVGAKYFHANNTLKTTYASEISSMFGIFIKYAYRKKAPSLS